MKSAGIWGLTLIVIIIFSCSKQGKYENPESTDIPSRSKPDVTQNEDTSVIKESLTYSGPYPYRELGKQANDKGFAFYEKKNYVEASRWFQNSILHDSLNLLPHYNLACTLCLLKSDGKEVDVQEIFEELQICTGLDPAYAGVDSGFLAERFTNDTDLDGIRSTKEFEDLIKRLSRKDYIDTEDLLVAFGFSDKYSYYHFSADHTWSFAVTHQSADGYGTWSLAQDGEILILDCTYARVDDLVAGDTHVKNEDESSRYDETFEFDRERILLTDTDDISCRYYPMGIPTEEGVEDYQLLAQLLSRGYSVSNMALGDMMFNLEIVPLFDEIFYRYASPALIRLFLGLPEATPEMVKTRLESVWVNNDVVEGFIGEKFGVMEYK